MDEVVIFMEVAVIAVAVIFWIFLFAKKITISEGNAGLGKCNGFRCWICRCIRRQRSDLEEGTYYMGCADLINRQEAESQEKNYLSVRFAELKSRLEAESQEKNDLSVRCTDLNSRLEAESQEKNNLSVRCTDLNSRLEVESQEKNDLSVRCAVLESRLETELQEKNDLSVRLSAIIASRIKDGNTTIVDLSDENRPTKLAEYFSELYDNEWTDCFDELDNQKLGESESIRILLKILTDIFNACLEWSTEDYFMLVQRAIDRTYIADRHTDERLGFTETAVSDNESENKGKGDAPSTTGDGPYDKQHESKAETNVYLDNPETTEAGQNGQGEEQSSTHYGYFFKHSEAPSHDNMEKGSSLDGQDRSRKALNHGITDKGKITNSEKEETELPKDLLQVLKEIKKRRALKVLPTIHEFIRRKIPALLQGQFASTHFQTYIQKCTEFSWLAVVQDPPLVLLADGGTKFDRKLFKEYMRRGPFVEFVVWPALLVEKEGAILSKGVAQGTNTAR